MDNSGNIVGKAMEEMQEELGLHIAQHELQMLSKANGIAWSAGLLDERMHFVLYKKVVPRAFLQSLQAKQTGLRAHGELISLHVLPRSAAQEACGDDAKFVCAMHLYEAKM